MRLLLRRSGRWLEPLDALTLQYRGGVRATATELHTEWPAEPALTVRLGSRKMAQAGPPTWRQHARTDCAGFPGWCPAPGRIRVEFRPAPLPHQNRYLFHRALA